MTIRCISISTIFDTSILHCNLYVSKKNDPTKPWYFEMKNVLVGGKKSLENCITPHVK